MLQTTTNTHAQTDTDTSEILHTLKILVHNHALKSAQKRADGVFLKGKARRDAITEFYVGAITTLDFLFSEINQKGSLVLPAPMFEIMRGEDITPMEKHPYNLLINANIENIFAIY